MEGFKISSNITKLRKEYGITQEELAGFLGVTKASVSKWENGQSFPDIMLLPRIAGYFNITIDKLVGYEAQMSKKRIKELYHKLAEDFTKLPFEEVEEEINRLEREYYSCYPLLMQLVILWTNHYNLAEEEKQQIILEKITELCNRIIEKSGDTGLANEAIAMKAVAQILMKRIEEAIESLEKILEPKRLCFTKQNEGLLIQAYQMNNQMDKAQELAQIGMYINLLSLIADGGVYFSMNMDNQELSERILKRLEGIMEVFQVDKLHDNTSLQLYYQATVFYCIYNRANDALRELKKFADCTIRLIRGGIRLHGDDFFTRLDGWLEDLDLGSAPVRNEKLVVSDIIRILENPALSILFEQKEYIKIKETILKEAENYARH